jgi:hypothetical protein
MATTPRTCPGIVRALSKSEKTGKKGNPLRRWFQAIWCEAIVNMGKPLRAQSASSSTMRKSPTSQVWHKRYIQGRKKTWETQNKREMRKQRGLRAGPIALL